jgi:hypothetical protein
MGLLCLGISQVSLAQGGNPAPTSPEKAPPAPENIAPIGGTAAIETIILEGFGLSIPLRHGFMIPDSALVDLDGRTLKADQDFTVDAPGGVIYLKVPVKKGQSLRVSYRYDPDKKVGAAGSSASLAAMKFQLGNSGSMMMGLGMAERTADGQVVSSDLFSFNNKFALAGGGGTQLTGVMAMGQRRKLKSTSSLERNADGPGTEEGSGTALVQKLSHKVGKGLISLDVQTIDQNFAGFASFRNAGFSEDAIAAYAKERGLRRYGLGIKDVQFGSFGFQQGYSFVGDSAGSIKQSSLSMKSGGLTLDFSSRNVDRGFKRFNDLKDSDRELLKKESGLTTTRYGIGFTGKGIGLKSDVLSFSTDAGATLRRSTFEANAGGWTGTFFTQSVDKTFNNFQGLRLSDAGQLGREAGFDREAIAVNSGKALGSLGVSYSESEMSYSNGSLETQDLRLSGSKWSFEHLSHNVSRQFNALERRSEAEIQGDLKRIAQMAKGSGANARNEDKGFYLQSSGIGRTSTRLGLDLGKGSGLNFDALALSGENGGSGIMAIAGSLRGTSFNYQSLTMDQAFSEVNRLTLSERERWGNIAGLSQTDFNLATQGKALGALTLSSMSASASDRHASRLSIGLERTGLSFKHVTRNVSENFYQVGQLNDPERDLLGSMIGQSQSQWNLNWQASKSLSLTSNSLRTDWDNGAFGMRDLHGFRFNLNSKSSLAFRTERFFEGTDEEAKIDQTVNNVAVQSEFGNGKFAFERETRTNVGTEDQTPSSERNSISVETRVSETVSISSGRDMTNFDGGGREVVQSQSVRTDLGKNAGISLTHTDINRKKIGKSETKNQLGFWVNLGRGIKFTYGSDRDNGRDAKQNQNFNLTGGQIGVLDFGGFNYDQQHLNNSRNRSVGNFALQSAKGIGLGPIKDFKFKLGTETVRDNALWQREQQIGNFSGSWSSVNFGFDYASQMTQSQQRAVDRRFQFGFGQMDKSRFAMQIMYKQRTLPNDQSALIRNYSAVYRPNAGFEIVHQLQTHLEVARPDAVLGSTLQPTKVSSWKVNQTSKSANTLFGISWEERENLQARTLSKISNLNVTLGAKSRSPLTLNLGFEDATDPQKRRTFMRYGLTFNQAPGPNQVFGLQVGNTSWQRRMDESTDRDNWYLRLNYQLRF